MVEENGHGGTRKGAGRPSKARSNDLTGAMQSAFKKVLKSLPKDKREQFKALAEDGSYDGDGREAVLNVMWEIALGIHSHANPDGEMAVQDLRKRFEATKELSRLYYGPSPEGIAKEKQSELTVKNISELISFKQKPEEDHEDNSQSLPNG